MSISISLLGLFFAAAVHLPPLPSAAAAAAFSLASQLFENNSNDRIA